MNALKHFTPGVTAVFMCRWILGLLFTMAGWWKVFDLGAAEHARQFFVDGFAESWIPVWLLWGLGVFIPYLEVVAGLLILAGFKLRWALTAVGLLLIVTTYGHALQQPLFDIDGHTFTRLALIVFLLTIGTGQDRATIDFWLTGPVISEQHKSGIAVSDGREVQCVCPGSLSIIRFP
jgi:uncharacterized membrane protein YphA (DoxX/SURF4 family)